MLEIPFKEVWNVRLVVLMDPADFFVTMHRFGKSWVTRPIGVSLDPGSSWA